MGVLVLLAAPASAQRFTAAIRGQVTDPGRAVIAGATVTLRNEGTGLVRTATTNEAGNYSFPDLPVGSYQVEVTSAGFKKDVRTRIAISVADVREVNVQLTTGDITEEVSVEASSYAVKTVGAEISGLTSGDQVRELPLNGRNFLQLTLLQPGVTAAEGTNTKSKGLLGFADMSVSGGSVFSNMWLVDGADNMGHSGNIGITVNPSLDAIEEFKIQRNNYGAEFGQAGGAQVNVVTRGGTNTFHGSGYYYARRDSWNSNEYFLKHAGQPTPHLKWDDFGGTFGGPIVKDKLLFFLSYERNVDDRTDVRSGFVPTAAERAGDFSEAPLAGCTPEAPIDPLTGRPFPGNVIPAARMSPAGLAYLGLFQLPTTTPSSGCSNYVQAVPTPNTWSQINARVDWNLRDKTRVMVRYTQDSWKADNTILWGDSPTSVVGSNWDQPGRSLVVQLNRTIGSTMTNTLTFSYSGNGITVSRAGDKAAVEEVNSLMPTIYPASVKESGGAAQPAFWGAGPYGAMWNQAPWKNNQDLYVLKDDYSAVFGRHFLKAGVLLSTNAKNEDVQSPSAESVQFAGAAGYLTPDGYAPGLTTGNPIADILLRDTAYATNELNRNQHAQLRWRNLEFYAADSYKVTPRVTADFGLRFSHLEPTWAADDQLANFVPAAVDPALGNQPCNGLQYPPGTNPCPGLGLEGGSNAPNRSLVPIKFLWVAPRLGVAWNVSGDGKMALRTGVGLFYERERVGTALSAGLNAPFSGTAVVVRTLDSNAPVEGDAASLYGAPSGAQEVKAGNAHYWQWNVAVERVIFPDTLVELAYVGTKGLGLLGQVNLNEVPPENRLEYARTGDAALRPLDGIAGIGNADLALWQHDRDSIYHGLQVALNSRFGHGSLLALAYTWSKVISNTAINLAPSERDSFLLYTDSTQPGLNRARGGTDRTHVFNASLVLALPTLADKSSFLRNAFGDWEFATIVQAGTGYPVTVTAAVPGLNGAGGKGNGPNAQLQTPNRVAGQPCSLGGANRPQWLNPAAFTLDGFEIGTNGTSGVNICAGPGMFQADASLYKNIRVGSRIRLQLRFEVYNVFNTVNFLAYSLNTGYNVDNVVFDTGDAATATRILSATPPGNFGQLTAARDPRTLQLGIRLTF